MANKQKLKNQPLAIDPIDPEIDMDSELNKRVSYVLLEENIDSRRIFDLHNRPIKERKYKLRRNLLPRCAIIWDGSDQKFEGEGQNKRAIPGIGHPRGKRYLRYYDGCSTLFVDEQPKDKEVIDQYMKSSRELFFQNGFLDIYAYETMLLKYVDMCSYNEGSPYRIRSVEAIFKKVDIDEQYEEVDSELDEIEEAMSNAKSAPEKHMLSHARFLGVEETDPRTGNPLSISAIRTAYRAMAKNDPKRFNESFNNKTLFVKAWIEQGIQSGLINTTRVPNKVLWNTDGGEICDISGFTTKEGILNKLIEFSQTKQGAGFLEQLEVMFN